VICWQHGHQGDKIGSVQGHVRDRVIGGPVYASRTGSGDDRRTGSRADAHPAHGAGGPVAAGRLGRVRRHAGEGHLGRRPSAQRAHHHSGAHQAAAPAPRPSVGTDRHPCARLPDRGTSGRARRAHVHRVAFPGKLCGTGGRMGPRRGPAPGRADPVGRRAAGRRALKASCSGPRYRGCPNSGKKPGRRASKRICGSAGTRRASLNCARWSAGTRSGNGFGSC
jgi:hypothetical protein